MTYSYDRTAKRKKPRRISVDAVVTFKHKGKKFTGRVKNTRFNGADKPMTYYWQPQGGGPTITTEGVPDDLEVLADVAYKDRL